MLVRLLVIRADAVIFFTFVISYEAFTAFAVPAFVICFIDMRIKLFPDCLDAFFVSFVSCANEVSIFNAKFFDEFLEFF